MSDLIKRLRELLGKNYPKLPVLASDGVVQVDKEFLCDVLDAYDALPALLAVVEAAVKVADADNFFTTADSYGIQLIRDLDVALRALKETK